MDNRSNGPAPLRGSGPVHYGTQTYIKLSGLYFFYFAALGALMPYIGLYLHGIGFSAREIGILYAIKIGARLFAPVLLAWHADHSGRPMRIVRAASVLSGVSFAGMFAGTGFWWLALVLGTWAFFFSAMLPQFEATALNHLGAQRYGGIRVWGSAGFIAAVAGLGALLGHAGTWALLPVTLALLAGASVFSFLVQGKAHPEPGAAQGGLLDVLRRPEVLALLAIGLFAQFAHGPYYSFFSLYLEGHGYSRASIGQFWALGVIAEIGVFIYMGRLLARFRPGALLAWSLALSVARWLILVQFADNMWCLAIAQVLHLASFGVFHAVTIGLVHRYFTGRLQGRGQALFSSLTFGAGNALGSLAAGYLWDGIGPAAIFAASAGAAGTALLLTIAMMKRFDT